MSNSEAISKYRDDIPVVAFAIFLKVMSKLLFFRREFLYTLSYTGYVDLGYYDAKADAYADVKKIRNKRKFWQGVFFIL